MRNLHLLTLAATAATLSACATARPPAAAPADVAAAPASFVALATEGQISRVIAVRNGSGKAASWRALTDYVAQRHSVAVRDQAAGFVMTSWEASLAREGVPDLRYRSRFVFNFLGENWTQLQIRSEASWKEGDEWQVGYDRVLLDRVTAELQSRLSP